MLLAAKTITLKGVWTVVQTGQSKCHCAKPLLLSIDTFRDTNRRLPI